MTIYEFGRPNIFFNVTILQEEETLLQFMLYNGWNCLHRGEFWYFRCCKNWLHQVNSFFRERWSFLSQPDQSNLRIHLCKKKKTFFKDDDIFRIRGAKRYYISTSRKNCFVALLKNSKEFSHKWRNLFLLLKFFDLVSNERFTLLLWMNVTTGSFMGRKKVENISTSEKHHKS